MQQTMIRVKDPEASLKFYCEGLGMSLLMYRDFPKWEFSVYFVAPVDPTKIPKDPDDQWTFCMNTPGCIEACVRARLGLLCSGLCSIAREVTHAHTRARARAAHVELRERGREWPRVQHWKFRHHRLDKRREGTGRLWPPRYHGAGCICGM